MLILWQRIIIMRYLIMEAVGMIIKQKILSIREMDIFMILLKELGRHIVEARNLKAFPTKP